MIYKLYIINCISYKTSAKDSETRMHYCPNNCCYPPGFGALYGTDGIMYNVCDAGGEEGKIQFAFDVKQ